MGDSLKLRVQRAGRTLSVGHPGRDVRPLRLNRPFSILQPASVPPNTCQASADLAKRLNRMYVRSPLR